MTKRGVLLFLLKLSPLAISGLAFLGLFYSLQIFREEWKFHRRGVDVLGWYTDLNYDYGECTGSNCSARFHYAYRVNDVVYDGTGLFEDAPSEIYCCTKVGHAMHAKYLSGQPWLSTTKAVDWDMNFYPIFGAFCLLVFISSVLFTYLILRRLN